MKRVIVVDDDDGIRFMLRAMLERAGYEVDELIDGTDLIALSQKQPTHLIITDIFMPNKDGFQSIKELRKDFKDVKIIAMSAGGVMDVDMCLETAKLMGADSVLPKPFDYKELINAVESLI